MDLPGPPQSSAQDPGNTSTPRGRRAKKSAQSRSPTPAPRDYGAIYAASHQPSVATAEPIGDSELVARILEVSPDAIVVVDATGHMRLVNQQTEKLFGYAREDLLGQPVERLIPARFQSSHPRHRAMYSAHPQTRPMGTGLTLFGRRQDGSEFPIEVSLSPLRLADQTLIISTIRDVSAQRELERRLQLQARLIEHAHDAVLVRDPAGQIRSFNQGAEALYGWTAREVLGQITHTLFQTRFPVSLAAVEAQLAQEGQWVGELAHSRADGQTIIVESQQVLIRDEQNSPSAVLEINRDITARRQLEQAREAIHAAASAQRDLLQELLDAIPSSVSVVHGFDGRLVLANSSAQQLWGAVWRPGQSMSEFLATHGIRLLDTRGQVSPPETWATLRALRQRETVLFHEQVIERPDHRRVPVFVNAMPLTSADWPLLGMPEHAVALGWRPSPEAQATAALEPLALVVHSDTTPFKEAERVKDEFIAMAAHELRNPIAAILGYAQMLQSAPHRPVAGQEPGDPPAASIAARGRLEEWQEEALANVLQGAQRLVVLTDELLDATRLQAGRLELRREPCDVVALARRVVRRQQGATTQHTLQVDATQDYVVVDADAARIEQVLTNLLSNSIKYSPDGGTVQISVTVAAGGGAPAGHAQVSVRDHGLGIPADEQGRLFGRFARATNARQRGIEGTGLGLFLCRELVERHGGRIWFESVEGQGTTFAFTLPLAPAAEEGEESGV